ncbi:uncharacterized protein LOC130407193 [Triplophysa dalaica]|uniref:uncharacterized protein LOC130407193 n=1 Tax=Triplophysa dalaica TaxID=1582913 RepID=UPI0024DFF468|nr:uncharacterized protein LOC130407193 [Triplophysa dalaica]
MDVWARYSGIKSTEERQRARSSIKRERVTVDLTQRPSTVPLENQTGRRAHSTPEIPTCKILWRRKDDQSFLQDGPQHSDQRPDLTPFLHLYLPSYQPEKKREESMEKQENSSEMHNKQAVTEEGREHDVITQSQNEDITDNKINEERQHYFTDGIQYDITDTSWHDISVGKTQEKNFENDITEGKKPQSITDNEVTEDRITQQIQCDITDVGESNNVPEDREQNDKQEKKNVHSRTRPTLHTRRVNKTSDGKLMGNTRYPAPSTALTFPYSLMDRNPSPTVSVLPSFYGTPFGYRIRKFNTPESGSSKTRTRKVYNDIRFIKPTNDMRHAIETKGNRCLLQTKAEVVISPRPKIMSTERGVPPHKIKTIKTFLWGPEGPQETKTVCELQSPVNRWRSSD